MSHISQNKPKYSESVNRRKQQRLCIKCHLYFESDDYLTKHINKNHVKDVRKQCPNCEKRPNNNYDLQKHIQYDHNDGWKVVSGRNNQRYDANRKAGNYIHHQRYNNYWEEGIPLYNRYAGFQPAKNGYRGLVV